MGLCGQTCQNLEILGTSASFVSIYVQINSPKVQTQKAFVILGSIELLHPFGRPKFGIELSRNYWGYLGNKLRG